ncbi:MAG: SCO family protein [Nitriliruptoraceae bacterium]
MTATEHAGGERSDDHGRPPRLRRRLAHLTAAVVVAALVAACSPTTSTALTATGLAPQADGWRGVPLAEQRDLPDVVLLDTDDAPFALRDELIGTPTLLFFGYTNCPDVCPIHMAAITAAMRLTDVTFDDLDVVFVSVDPDRDTPARIDEWLRNFDTRIIGLHEDLDVIAVALDALRMPGPVIEGPDPRGEGDLIGHPAQVLGFDAQGRALRAWPFGTRRSDWVLDLPRIVEEWSTQP